MEWGDTQVAVRLSNNMYKKARISGWKLMMEMHNLLFLGPMSFSDVARLHQTRC